jgi:5-aminopentanamidase
MRVAAWQCAPGVLDPDGNLERLAAACREASALGVEVLVTPEMFLTGYAIGADRVRELARPARGAWASAVGRIAAEAGVAVVYGFPERDGEAVYNAATFVDRSGAVVAVHRKVHLWGEVDRSQFTAAPAAPAAFDAAAYRLGMLICYDAEFPEAVRRLAVEGAGVVLVPTANPAGYESVQRILLPARALENGCALVYADYCGSDGQLAYSGLSTIVAADGTVLAQASADAEELVVAEVTPPERPSEYVADRRPELYGEQGPTNATSTGAR